MVSRLSSANYSIKRKEVTLWMIQKPNSDGSDKIAAAAAVNQFVGRIFPKLHGDKKKHKANLSRHVAGG